MPHPYYLQVTLKTVAFESERNSVSLIPQKQYPFSVNEFDSLAMRVLVFLDKFKEELPIFVFLFQLVVDRFD